MAFPSRPRAPELTVRVLKRSGLLAAACASLVTMPAPADETFRCGQWLITADVSVKELLNKCGKPTSKQVSREPVRNYRGALVGSMKTETWRYDRGARAAAMIVTVIDGRIDKIVREGFE